MVSAKPAVPEPAPVNVMPAVPLGEKLGNGVIELMESLVPLVLWTSASVETDERDDGSVEVAVSGDEPSSTAPVPAIVPLPTPVYVMPAVPVGDRLGNDVTELRMLAVLSTSASVETDERDNGEVDVEIASEELSIVTPAPAVVPLPTPV